MSLCHERPAPIDGPPHFAQGQANGEACSRSYHRGVAVPECVARKGRAAGTTKHNYEAVSRQPAFLNLPAKIVWGDGPILRPIESDIAVLWDGEVGVD
jgi:hypothetical protein